MFNYRSTTNGTVPNKRIAHSPHCLLLVVCLPLCIDKYTNASSTTQTHPAKRVKGLLLLGHTDGTSATAGGLGVLTAHTKAPVVTQTTVGTDLLQSLQILTQLRVHIRGGQLRVLAVDDVLLSVQEPVRDLVLARVRDDRDDLLDLKENGIR